MSSISPQAVVERASAEISKRINGLGLRTKHHHANNAAAAAAAAAATAATTTTTTTSPVSSSSTVPATAATTTTATASGCITASTITTTTTANTTTSTTTTATINSSKSSSVMERVTHVLCGGNFNQTASSNNQASKNMNIVVVMADKQARNTSTPSLATSPSNIVIGNTNAITGNSNYQLQTQIAGSTLVQSNLAPTPAALGLTAIGAPPAPTVTSIAKQMNIPLPGNLAASTITSTNLKSNARKTIIAHHPYATPGIYYTHIHTYMYYKN